MSDQPMSPVVRRLLVVLVVLGAVLAVVTLAGLGVTTGAGPG